MKRFQALSDKLRLCSRCGRYSGPQANFCDSCGKAFFPTQVFVPTQRGFRAFVAEHPRITIVVGSIAIWGALILVAIFIGVSVASVSTSNNVPAAQTDKKTEGDKKKDGRITMAALGAQQIKRSMRDPDSFKLTSVLIIDKTGAVCYEYRGRNGFNGMNFGQAVFSANSRVFKTNEMAGFSKAWNKECAHQEGTENVEFVSWLIK
jgi:hypothetical protein